ncbi:MAG: hypothetical protein M5U34_22780 [Chloroflexi bacterium]|nr:hypothetical protein [Chloroflexota bacterium]
MKVWQKTLEFIDDHAEIGEKRHTPSKCALALHQKGRRPLTCPAPMSSSMWKPPVWIRPGCPHRKWPLSPCKTTDILDAYTLPHQPPPRHP